MPMFRHAQTLFHLYTYGTRRHGKWHVKAFTFPSESRIKARCGFETNTPRSGLEIVGPVNDPPDDSPVCRQCRWVMRNQGAWES